MSSFLLLFIISAAITSCGGRRSKRVADEQGVVINGVRWATRNVDAPGTFAEFPESSGMLFQWNRRKGWNATDRYVEGWDSSMPTGTAWYIENDPCPQGWRVPTQAEFQSLYDATITFPIDWYNMDWAAWDNYIFRYHWFVNWMGTGVRGMLFGTPPDQIFLPASARRWFNGALVPVTGRWSYAGYWSATCAGSLYIPSVESGILAYGDRTFGLSVRCVAK